MTHKISQVLKQLMDAYPITSSELSRETGIVQPVIYRMARGQTDNPKIETLIPLARFFDISLGALVGNEPISQIAKRSKARQEEPSYYEVPVLSWCGLEPIKNTTLEKTFFKVSDRAFALKIVNTSFEPVFSNGAMCIFDPDLEVEHNDYVLVQQDKAKHVTIKRLVMDGGDRYLKPLNPELRTLYLDKKSKVMVLGRLVVAWRGY